MRSPSPFVHLLEKLSPLFYRPVRSEAKDATFIPPNCIHTALAMAPSRLSGTSFKIFRCESEGAKLGESRRVYKPCDEQMKLSRAISSELQSALLCLRDELKSPVPVTGEEIFKLIAHESRFVPNVANPGGFGMMQLTSIAVREFVRNGSDTQRAWKKIEEGKSANCRLFLDDPRLVSQHQPQRRGRDVGVCQFILPKGDGLEMNPRRSIIYGLLLYSSYKERAGKAIKNNPETLGILKRACLDKPQIVEGFITELTRMSYNLGESSARRAWNDYVAFLNRQPEANNCSGDGPKKGGENSNMWSVLFKKFVDAIVPPPQHTLEKAGETDDPDADSEEEPEEMDLARERGSIPEDNQALLRRFFHQLKVKAGDPKYTSRIDEDYNIIKAKSKEFGEPCQF